MNKGQRDRLEAAQARVDAALKRHEEALAARDTRLTALRRDGVSVSGMARVVGLHRTRVQDIVTDAAGPPAGLGVSRGKNPTDEQADELRKLQDEVIAAEVALGKRAGDDPTVYDQRARVFVALEAEGVGPYEQAEVLGIHRMNVQTVLDENRRFLRRTAAAGIPEQQDRAPGE